VSRPIPASNAAAGPVPTRPGRRPGRGRRAASLHNRAGILIFAASFAGSLLGGRALADGLGAWDWAGAALLAGIGLLRC